MRLIAFLILALGLAFGGEAAPDYVFPPVAGGGGGGSGTVTDVVVPAEFSSAGSGTATITITKATEVMNSFWAGPTSGADAQPTFRLIDPLDVPNLNTSKLTAGQLGGARGGTGIDNGTKTITLGGNLVTSGAFNTTFTIAADVNATIPSGTNTLYSTKAASITSAQLLASLTNPTGTGVSVFSISPQLTTPNIGAATATSVNGMTLTASTGTFTLANGKVWTVSNTLTATGTDGSTVAFGAGGTVFYTGNLGANVGTLLATYSSANARAAYSDEDGTGAALFAGFSAASLPPLPTVASNVYTYGNITWVLKTSDETIQSDQTLSNDADLAVSVAANEICTIEVFIYGTFDGTADFQAAFTGPASPTSVVYFGSGTRSTNTALTLGVANAFGTSINTPSTTGLGAMRFDLMLVNGSNAGTVNFQWAQLVSTAANTTVYGTTAKSFLKKTKLNDARDEIERRMIRHIDFNRPWSANVAA